MKFFLFKKCGMCSKFRFLARKRSYLEPVIKIVITSKSPYCGRCHKLMKRNLNSIKASN